MKKILLLLLCILMVALIHAQNRGYFWYFNSSPFNSIPAHSGSTGSYTLTTIGSGSITPGTNDNVVLGGCNGNFQVGGYTKPFGLVFSNNPSYVGDTYTISMVFKYTDQGAPNEWKRIVTFENPATPFPNNWGVFIASGSLNFYEGANIGTYVTGNIFPINTYFQLDLVRDGTTKLITIYKNAVQVGTFLDIADRFKPKASGSFGISFFKGTQNEESSGRVVKMGIFNYKLPLAEIQQSFANICNASFIILPVTLKEFTAKKIQEQVELSWTTSGEHNNRGFEIQRSADGINFTAIGWANAVANPGTSNNYSFIDATPVKGKNFYRLKQMDIDGHFKLSPVRKIDFENPVDFTIYPNPAKDVVNIQLSEKAVTIKIMDLQGRLLWQKENASNSLFLAVPVEPLAKGMYIIKVADAGGNIQTQKFIKE